MPLQTSSFPIPETRFFKAESFIFRFKIKGGTTYREETIEDDGFNQEMEEIIRTVIGNLDNLQPFCTNRYIIFPYKKRWEVSENLPAVYPYTIILYVEKNMDQEKKKEVREKKMQHVKRRLSDSPLEEAILIDLIKDMDAERHVTAKMDTGHQHGAEANSMIPVLDKMQDTKNQEGTPVGPGILKRMARLIFPFFFKSPENSN